MMPHEMTTIRAFYENKHRPSTWQYSVEKDSGPKRNKEVHLTIQCRSKPLLI